MQALLVAVLAGLGTGVLSGLVGIGGGVVLVPILLYLFKAKMHVAAATSLAIIIPTSVVGVISHLSAGNVNWKLVLAIVPGSIIGVSLGAYLAQMLPATTLKRIFAVLLLVISINILLDSFGLGLTSRARQVEKTGIEHAAIPEKARKE